jgi:hypothetical protein
MAHWICRAIANEREFMVFDMVLVLPRPSSRLASQLGCLLSTQLRNHHG